MKFGKRMRSLAAPAWDGDYVDYKLLKKMIKALVEPTPGASGVPDDRDDGVAAFELALQQQMQRLNLAHARILSELKDSELRARQNELGNRWVLSPSQARSLLLGAIELCDKVDAFRRFIVLNSLALVKISKKFDKMCPGHDLRTRVLEQLKRQSFYDGAAMDQLCAATSAFTDRVMLCVLPDGNFRVDPHDVSCPICLHAQVKNPITLSCRHTFCWSCLSKAAEHRFHSCPLCRKHQSIDPRDYAIDGLLKRFKRAYEFVEAALDRAPFVSSPMRQILMEGFTTVNAHLREVEAQYAALSPRSPTNRPAASPRRASMSFSEPKDGVDKTTMEEAHEHHVANFAKGDAVEVLYNNDWYPGMILHPNDDSATYSVLWWMADNSQRCGQRMPPHLLRVPVFPEESHHALFDFAAGAWKTATEWALGPFRRLRSGSFASDRSSTVA
ncbi:hypothetical protein PINS_up000644 [Pythium insidiosum]|nr:hypothetical protein PINS_up000644 [Pythium insidiosum]